MARTEEQIYKVHSGVRRVHTRLKRMKAAGRQRFVQRFAGGDIVVRRVRPATITESQLRAHLPELKRAYEEGRAEVRTVTGDPVDLNTLKPLVAKKVSPPKPAPPLDSAAADKQFPGGVGEKMPIFEGGKAIDEEMESPSVATLPGDELEDSDDMESGDPVEARKKARSKKKKGK